MALPDASAEKALAAVTAGGAVVLACGLVPTDGTVGDHAIIPMTDAGLRWHAFYRSHSKPTHRYHSNCLGLISSTAIDLSLDYVGCKMRHVCFAGAKNLIKSLARTCLIFIPSKDVGQNQKKRTA